MGPAESTISSAESTAWSGSAKTSWRYYNMGRGVLAKAMVICIDKATTVRTFDKVEKHWEIAIAKLKAEPGAADPIDKPELGRRLQFFEQTDMAAVLSQ